MARSGLESKKFDPWGCKYCSEYDAGDRHGGTDDDCGDTVDGSGDGFGGGSNDVGDSDSGGYSSDVGDCVMVVEIGMMRWLSS